MSKELGTVQGTMHNISTDIKLIVFPRTEVIKRNMEFTGEKRYMIYITICSNVQKVVNNALILIWLDKICLSLYDAPKVSFFDSGTAL